MQVNIFQPYCRRKIQPVKVASQRETEFVVLLYFILWNSSQSEVKEIAVINHEFVSAG